MKTGKLKRSHQAYTRTEVVIIVVILAFVALLVILGPASRSAKARAQAGINCRGAKTRAQRTYCVNNPRKNDDGAAFRMWEDLHGTFPMGYKTNDFDGPGFATQQRMFIYFQVMSNLLSSPKSLVCPADDRLPVTNFAGLNNSNISYFAGLNADETTPEMFLAGDSNLTTNGVPTASGVALIKSTVVMGWTTNRHDGQGNVALADGSVQGLRLVPSQPGTNVMHLVIP